MALAGGQPDPNANESRAATDEAVARLIVSFHGDPKRLDFQDRVQLRLAKAPSGQALPYATLMSSPSAS